MRKRIIPLVLILLLVFIYVPSVYAANNTAINAANALYTLGLFQGTGTNPDGTPIFDLDRTPTRHEAITMLVRLLGKDNEAKSTTWNTPFIDVAEWAKPYVGYAYNHKLTSGAGAIEFGGNNTVTASQYITFILRALGYNSDTDFAWDSAWTLSDSLGITNGKYSASSKFTRADVAEISYNALKVAYKGKSTTLLSDLVSAGVIRLSEVKTVGLDDALGSESQTASKLNAEEISSKCSPSVFYIEVFSKKSDYPNYPSASGSGFFINSDGIAITCYHVLKDSEMATAMTIDGDMYQISEVLFADKNRDIAIIKVSKIALHGSNSSTFSYLRMQKSDTILNGMTCYAIGSPLGLQNTISNGIVSNTSRKVNNMDFIQTTASISSGSSGGALINEYGDVIGVTSAYFAEGHSLNLAIPLDLIISIDLTQKGTTFFDYFADKNINVADAVTSPNCYYKTNVKTYMAVTKRDCNQTIIMGEGAAKFYDGYIEGGNYFYEYSYEEQALDDFKSYLEYLSSIGFKEREYAKQIDSVSKDYYIRAKYSNGTETIDINYSNYYRRVHVEPPYQTYGGTIINNNISFYSNYPRVPDAAVYFSLTLVNVLDTENGYFYIYDAKGLPSGAPIIYTVALSESGFVYSHTNEYDDSVYRSGLLRVYSYFSDAGYFVVGISD